jgi:hypothetical protein
MAGTSLVERMKGAALLDFSTGMTIITAVLGWIPFAVIMAMLGMG